MSRPRIRIVEQSNTLQVTGRRAGDLLRGGGFKPIFVGTAQAYLLDRNRLADLAAYLDYRNVPFEITRGDAE